MRCTSLLLASLLAAGGTAASPAAAADPAPRFRLTFEDGFNAEGRGRVAPLPAPTTPARVTGISGSGLRLGAGQALRYPARDHLNKSDGTLALWLKLEASQPGAGAAPIMLLSEDAPEEAGNSRLVIELFPGRFLRVTLNDPRNSQVFYHGAADWTPEEWHHVAVSWNPLKGASVHVDGQLAGIGWMRQWTPETYETFTLGSARADANGRTVVVDDVRLYDRGLTDAQARNLYQEHRRLAAKITLHDPFLPAGQAGAVPVSVRNPGETPLRLEQLRFQLLSAEGAAVQAGALPDLTVDSLGTRGLPIPLEASPAGNYQLRLSYREAGENRRTETTLVVVEPRPTARPQPEALTLLTQIDATTQAPVAATGENALKRSTAGAYREAGPNVHDRFALDFRVEDVDQPHVAVITYPDDKPRTMEVMLQDFGNVVDFQVHTGIYAGEEFALSRGMLEHRVVFWPRSPRQAFTFMTAEDGRPAAVARIEVYRLDQFAVATQPHAFQGSVPARTSGLYFEDPVLFHNFGTGRDRAGFMDAADRLVQYLQSFGQTEFEYPLAWYAGPLYGTAEQPLQPDIEGGQGGVRPHPPGYPEYLLQRLAEQGIRFTAGLHIHTLPSLNDAALADRARIDAGEETAININKDGQLWYGYWHGADPNLNAADPRVMSAVNSIVDEILVRYAAEPAFDGISLIMARPKVFTFGSLASGYNDSNLQRFQQDTGVTIPVYQRHDPERFTKSYTWLVGDPAAKEAWIDWRCDILYQHYARMAERFAARRPDLQLKLNVFIHPSTYGHLADYLDKPAVEFVREMGIDPARYRGHPNIVLNYTLIPADYRWMRRSHYLPEFPGVSRTVNTAPAMAAPYSELDDVRVTIHDRYWEDAVGKEQPMPGLAEIGVQEMVWRASTLNPTRFNSLEPYVLALHHFDATSVVKGGYVLGTLGMESELEPFSRALGTLPATRFDDVPAAADPVRVRQKVVDGRLYVYVLNTLPEPVRATLQLAGNAVLTEIGTTEAVDPKRVAPLSLAPYQLRTFVSAAPGQRVTGATVEVPAPWLADLEQRYRRLLAGAERAGNTANERAPYLAQARDAWEQQHYSRLYFLLQEHWAVALSGSETAESAASR